MGGRLVTAAPNEGAVHRVARETRLPKPPRALRREGSGVAKFPSRPGPMPERARQDAGAARDQLPAIPEERPPVRLRRAVHCRPGNRQHRHPPTKSIRSRLAIGVSTARRFFNATLFPVGKGSLPLGVSVASLKAATSKV